MTELEVNVAGRPGIGRRTLIRRAAVTGAVAWTAPMILDSLASPAAAATPPCGCTIVAANGGGCNVNCDNVACVAQIPACDPPTECRTDFTSCVVAAQTKCQGDDAPVVFNISSSALCANCVFLFGSGNLGPNNCANGVVSNAGRRSHSRRTRPNTTSSASRSTAPASPRSSPERQRPDSCTRPCASTRCIRIPSHGRRRTTERFILLSSSSIWHRRFQTPTQLPRLGATCTAQRMFTQRRHHHSQLGTFTKTNTAQGWQQHFQFIVAAPARRTLGRADVDPVPAHRYGPGDL
jgi:hypothetical protein